MKLNAERLPLQGDDEVTVTLTVDEFYTIKDALFNSRRKFLEEFSDSSNPPFSEDYLIEQIYTFHVLYCNFRDYCEYPF